MENNQLEFRVFGTNIEKLSILYGLFLSIWGVFVSFLAQSSSFTSYIPSYLGLIILIFAFLSIKFTNKKKIFMHIVALFGLITMLGGLDFIRLIINNRIFENFWADISKLMMLITGSVFVYFCFMSFRFARKSISDNN